MTISTVLWKFILVDPFIKPIRFMMLVCTDTHTHTHVFKGKRHIILEELYALAIFIPFIFLFHSSLGDILIKQTRSLEGHIRSKHVTSLQPIILAVSSSANLCLGSTPSC